MTSYEILRYPTIFFWDIPDAAHWNIRGIAFVNLGQFEVFSGESVLCGYILSGHAECLGDFIQA